VLEVWSALYPDKPFGLNNKNIISYSMVAMVYAEIELKRKVDWRTLFTRNKEDRTKYAKANVPDNFSFFQQNVGVGPALDARGANRNTSRSTRIVHDEDSLEKTICFAKSGSRYKDEGGASASRKLDSTLPRLEGDIQDVGSVGGSNLNLIELQRDLIILTSKYELLQHDACHSRKGHQKLERDRGIWILEKAHMKEEFKVLKSSEVRIQGLHGDEQKKCAALAQQLADVSTQLTSREEALKEVQNELQLQKERSDMFMSFVDGETNKVEIRKLLRELEHLQERINKRDVDRVVDSVLNDVLDNDVSKLEPRASGPEGNHPRRFGEMVGSG
jgi:chromosome segregation ATPase